MPSLGMHANKQENQCPDTDNKQSWHWVKKHIPSWHPRELKKGNQQPKDHGDPLRHPKTNGGTCSCKANSQPKAIFPPSRTSIFFAALLTLAFALPLCAGLFWSLANATEGTHTVTVTVDDYAGSFETAIVNDGESVGMNPTELLDDSDSWPLQQLATQKKEQHYELSFQDAGTGAEFDWYETPVTSDLQIRGVWKEIDGYNVTVVFDDDDENEKSVIVPFGKSWFEAFGSVPATPTKKGYTFSHWEAYGESEDEEATSNFDFKAEVTENTVVTAIYELNDVEEAPYDATEEPPEEISSTCHVSRAWLGKRTSWGSHAYFNVSSFKGYLKGKSGVAVCVDPGSDSYNHGTYTYKATRTSWNKETGKVTYKVIISPKKHPCTGKLYTKNKKGYQRGKLTITLTKQPYAHIKLQKISSCTRVSTSCDYYDLSGATYEVKNSKGTVVSTLVTDSQGNTSTTKRLPLGTYTYRETKAAKGYELDTSTHTIKLTSTEASSGTCLSKCSDTPYTPLRIKKTSADAALVKDNGCYTLAGATFEVRDADDKKVCELTTDDEGNTPLSTPLPEGTYRICETKAPEGYEIDNSTYSLKVSNDEAGKDGVVSFVRSDTPATDKAEVLLDKTDRETTKRLPLSAATLKGALFSVKYYAGYFDEATDALAAEDKVLSRSWTFVTDGTGEIVFDEDHLTEGDKLFVDANGNKVLPLGTYVIKETCAPSGYNANASTFVRQVRQKEDTKADDTFDRLVGADSVSEQVKRGDIRFVKCAEETQARLANVPFVIMSQTTGEWHMAITDENGLWSSAASYNPHTQETNANDGYVQGIETRQGEDGTWNVDASKATVAEEGLSHAAGCWFGQDAEGTRPEANDSLSALPYDSYHIQELRCSANKGRELVGFDVSITRDTYEIDLGTITNNEAPAYLMTTATDSSDGNKKIKGSKQAKVNDVVEFHGLSTETTYRLETWLVNKQTKIVVSKAESKFTPKASDGQTTVDIEFDASKLSQDTQLVVFETLYHDEDDWQVAKHADLDDEGQTVAFEKTSSGKKKHKQQETTGIKLPKTIDKKQLLGVGACALAALAILGITSTIRRRRQIPEGKNTKGINAKEQARQKALGIYEED